MGEVFDRRYDSAQWLTEAPTYYFAGTSDPAAPYEGAVYHFDHQTRSHRNFVQVPGGGHATISEIFPDCKDRLWESILNGQDLTWVTSSCIAPVTVTVR